MSSPTHAHEVPLPRPSTLGQLSSSPAPPPIVTASATSKSVDIPLGDMESNSESFDGNFGGSGVMGKAQGFLNQKGYAWLLELDDDDDFGEEGGPKPLLEELDIDFNDIMSKVRCVIRPTKANTQMLSSQADFWGPLFVMLTYSLLLVWNQFKVVSWIITIWLVGSFLLSILGRVLGANTPFSRTLGILGYCVVPLVFVACSCIFLSWVPIVPYLVKVFGVFWATYAASSILFSDVAPDLERKQPLLMYPLFLFYIYLMTLHAGV